MPHSSLTKVTYWEHPNIEDWDEFAQQVEEICELHATAKEQYETEGKSAGQH